MSLWSPSGVPDDRLQRLASQRLNYAAEPLLLQDLPAAPGSAFAQWFDAAERAGVLEPNAMAIATVGEDGVPSARTVLLKGVSATGFQFFTNYQSTKGRQLAAHPVAALLFAWLPLSRQVGITGTVVRLSAEESDGYFASRPRDSQIAAWASPQSQRIGDREALSASLRRFEAEFADGPVPRPAHWGGFEVRPFRLEFWQGQPSRMHDRVVYTTPGGVPGLLAQASDWQRVRLAP